MDWEEVRTVDTGELRREDERGETVVTIAGNGEKGNGMRNRTMARDFM